MERQNSSSVHRREAAELSNSWGAVLAFRMRFIAVLLSSSPPALYLVFSCFVFTVEYTWRCPGIAWVSIDFSPLCRVGRFLMQGFRDTQGFVVFLYCFSMSSPWPSLFIHHKNALSLCAAHLTPSESRPHWCSRGLTGAAGLSITATGCTKTSAVFILKKKYAGDWFHLGDPCICNSWRVQKWNGGLMELRIAVDEVTWIEIRAKSTCNVPLSALSLGT